MLRYRPVHLQQGRLCRTHRPSEAPLRNPTQKRGPKEDGDDPIVAEHAGTGEGEEKDKVLFIPQGSPRLPAQKPLEVPQATPSSI